MDFYTHQLRWSDVKPEERRFDKTRAREIVQSFVWGFDWDDDRGGYWEDCLDQLLVQEFGVWIGGWRSGEDGGPVRTRLCKYQSKKRIFSSVMSALKLWSRFLTEFDQILEELPLDADADPTENVEMAAARLIPMVLRRTDAQDAWYRTCALALNWYLEANGLSDRSSRAAVDRTIGGHFGSWCTPTPEQMERAAQKTARVIKDTHPLGQEDSLELWLKMRESASEQWPRSTGHHAPLREDGHNHYIRNVEKDERMLVALTASRAWAAGTEPLKVDVLRAWQKLVLSQGDVSLRTTDAFAKNGRERYGVAHLSRFGELLAEANDSTLTPQWRGAMAYLDVCFFHPFEDGNARLARLVLDAILWRAGYALNYVEPVFVVARAAIDRGGGGWLASAVDHLLGERSCSRANMKMEIPKLSP